MKCELSFIVIVLQDCLFMTRQGETLTAGVLIPVWVQWRSNDEVVGKVSLTKLMVTILGQRTFAPS